MCGFYPILVAVTVNTTNLKSTKKIHICYSCLLYCLCGLTVVRTARSSWQSGCETGSNRHGTSRNVACDPTSRRHIFHISRLPSVLISLQMVVVDQTTHTVAIRNIFFHNTCDTVYWAAGAS